MSKLEGTVAFILITHISLSKEPDPANRMLVAIAIRTVRGGGG